MASITGLGRNVIICMPHPYVDVIDCNHEQAESPISCPNTNKGAIWILFFVMLFLSLFIVVGNVFIILVITKNKTFHNNFDYLRISLAVADLIVGFFIIPVGVVEMARVMLTPFDKDAEYGIMVDMEAGWWKNQTVYKNGSNDNVCSRINSKTDTLFALTCAVIGLFSVTASIYSLVLLSLDRFYAVFSPIKYNQRKLFTNKNSIGIILAMWFFCILIGAVFPIAGKKYFKSIVMPNFIYNLGVTNFWVGTIYLLLCLIVPYIAMFGFNVGTAVILLKRFSRGKTKLKSNVSFKRTASVRSQRSHVEVRATVTLLLMILVFTVCTFPAIIVFVVQGNQVINDQLNLDKGVAVLTMVTTTLLVSNSAFNFLIYSLRCNNFRKTLKEIIRGQIMKLKSPVSAPNSSRTRAKNCVRAISWIASDQDSNVVEKRIATDVTIMDEKSV